MKPVKLLLAIALVPLCTRAQAATTAEFLKIGVGARAAAMGGAQTAVADDITAIYWNPAGLAKTAKTELGAAHAELYGEAKYDFIGVSRRFDAGVMAFGVNYLYWAALEGRDANRAVTGDFTANDLAASVAFARDIGGVSVGAAGKFIRSKIETESATGFALDLGARYGLNELPITLGAAASNIGPKMKFISEAESLPLTLAGGVAYRPVESLTLAAEYRKRPYDNDNEFGFGAECKALDAIALRAGYNTKSADIRKTTSGGMDNMLGLSAGLGITLAAIQLDYAFTPSGELGNTQNLSITVKF